MTNTQSVVMLGATGAVGGHAARRLAQLPDVTRLSLLGRRPAVGVTGDCVSQHTVDIFDSSTYASILPGHDAAVCTLGVGQPSKMSQEEFVRIDHDAVLTFATCCVFRRKSAIDSDSSRPPIPTQVGHRFRFEVGHFSRPDRNCRLT